MIKLAASLYFPVVQEFNKGLKQKIVLGFIFPIYNFFALGVLLLFYFMMQCIERFFKFLDHFFKLKKNFDIDELRKMLFVFVYWLIFSLGSSITLAVMGLAFIYVFFLFICIFPVIILIFCVVNLVNDSGEGSRSRKNSQKDF